MRKKTGSLGERIVCCLKRVLSIPVELLKQCFECIQAYFQNKSPDLVPNEAPSHSPSVDLQATPSSPSTDLQPTLSPTLPLIESKPTHSSLVDFFVSRFTSEEDPIFYQKVSELFSSCLPDMDMVEQFKHDPVTDQFEYHLTRAHQKGNEWAKACFEPVIRGHFETMKDGRIKMTVDEGISVSSFGYTRAAKLLYLEGSRFHTTIHPSVLLMKNFSMDVEEALKWSVGFKTLTETA